MQITVRIVGLVYGNILSIAPLNEINKMLFNILLQDDMSAGLHSVNGSWLHARLSTANVFRPGNGSPNATNVVLLVIRVLETFSFRNRSSLNIAYRLVTIFSTKIALCRIFKLSPNYLSIFNHHIAYAYTQQQRRQARRSDKAGFPSFCRQSVEQSTYTPHLSTVTGDLPAASQNLSFPAFVSGPNSLTFRTYILLWS